MHSQHRIGAPSRPANDHHTVWERQTRLQYWREIIAHGWRTDRWAALIPALVAGFVIVACAITAFAAAVGFGAVSL